MRPEKILMICHKSGVLFPVAKWERKLSVGHIKLNLLALHTFEGNQVTRRMPLPPENCCSRTELNSAELGSVTRQDPKSFKHFCFSAVLLVAPPANIRLCLCVAAINSKITIAIKMMMRLQFEWPAADSSELFKVKLMFRIFINI